MSIATDQFDVLEARGPAKPRVGFTSKDMIIRWKNCPDCEGRGWFLINPFATGAGGFGGIGNSCQCQTCVHAQKFYEEHKREPWLQKKG